MSNNESMSEEARSFLGVRASNEAFVEYLRGLGMTIGEGTKFYDTITTMIDIQNPKLVTMGKNIKVSSGCKFLTHDYSWSVISSVYGECLGGVGPITIGDNVFIGVNVVILRNTVIGNNVVIGAGSIVSGKLEDDSVYVGSPARKIMTLEEFYQKRKKSGLRDIETILSMIDVNDTDEVWKYLREYSNYFEDSPEELKESILKDSGNYELCKAHYAKEGYAHKLSDFLDK